MLGKFFTLTSALVAILALIETGASLEKWEIKSFPATQVAPFRVMYVDPATGWISTSFPGILRTNDGGQSWSRPNSNLKTEGIDLFWFVSPEGLGHRRILRHRTPASRHSSKQRRGSYLEHPKDFPCRR